MRSTGDILRSVQAGNIEPVYFLLGEEYYLQHLIIEQISKALFDEKKQDKTLLLSLWWSGTTRKGIIAGLLTGFLTTIIWANTELKLIVTERLVSFVFAFLMVVIVSRMDKDKT